MKSEPSFGKFAFSLGICVFQIITLVAIVFHKGNIFFAGAFTFGDTSAPSNVLTYLDALFSQSLANYKKTIADNIGALNAFFYKMIKSDFYESYDGGTDIRENLMYELQSGDWYDGYDELPDQPEDGITQSIWPARQMAIPISYSMKEVIQNKQRITDLVKTKLTQGDMAAQETFSVALMQGSGAGALDTPRTGSSGASAIDPIAKLIEFTPTTTLNVGNIDQGANAWWRNKTSTSSATSGDGNIQEALHIFNSCSLGTGGQPDLVLVDQTSYELMSMSLYQRYRQTQAGDTTFPFTNIRLPFGNGSTLMVMDDKVPDIYNSALDATVTNGTEYYMNTKFMRVRYIPERDFEMLEDENGKTFAKPLKGDSRLGHIGWMGATTVSNRRKHGVRGKIARTLTFSI